MNRRQNVVMRCLNNISFGSLTTLLRKYQLSLTEVKREQDIPHSYWGAPEAGRLKTTMYVRADTPIHSVLHETAHYICMPPQRREAASTDAKGSLLEENASCYLQIILADYINGMNRHILMNDMDSWGYSFRLGSAARWFYADSDDAYEWLVAQNILTPSSIPSWQLRQIG